MVSAAAIAGVTERIVERFAPARIVLFGSYARGEERPGSDVDLLVVLDDAPDRRAARIAIRRAILDLRVPADIIVTTPREIAERGHLAGSVLRPALREGKTLYRRDRMNNRDEALRWLGYAAADLAAARLLAKDPEMPPRHACYFAQQAAAKALKAAAILVDIEPPRSHDLDSLRDTLPGGWEVQSSFTDLAGLSEWNAMGRYPGDWPDASPTEADEAIATAEAVLASIEGDFLRRGVGPA